MFKTEEGLKAGKVVSNVTTVWIVGAMILIMILGGAFIDWIGFGYLGFATIIVALTLNAVVIIPTVYFGVATRFKKRIKRGDEVIPLEEGINFVLPLVDDLLPDNTKSKKLTTKEVKASALSNDKLKINIEGSVQYRPENLNVYIEMTPKTIEEGMVDAIESEVGKICGVKDADTFVEKRSEIELLIQSVLQLERPPHHYIDEAGEDGDRQKKFIDNTELKAKNAKKRFEKVLRKPGEDQKERDKLKVASGTTKVMGLVLKENIVEVLLQLYFLKKVDCGKIKEWIEKLSPEKWLLEEEVLKEEGKGDIRTGEIDVVLFYKDNASRIALLFEIKDAMKAESQVEKLYGIKVATFRLAKLLFSDEAQKAFEKMRAAKAEMAAAEKRFGTKVGLLQKYILAGLTPTQAVNLVETTSDVKGVTRQIISVEGSQQADLLAFANLLAGKGGEK